MRPTHARVVYEGQLVSVRVERFERPDGESSEREIVSHPGAVAVVAHDEEHVFMVRQPREAVGAEALLEVPAGKLDVEGEGPLECAQRELEEEVGLRAARWRELKRIYTSPGFTNEQVHIFAATELEPVPARPSAGERIEPVRWPLGRLGALIEQCEDAKSLVGLLLLAAERA